MPYPNPEIAALLQLGAALVTVSTAGFIVAGSFFAVMVGRANKGALALALPAATMFFVLGFAFELVEPGVVEAAAGDLGPLLAIHEAAK